jgi:hypothetical protein
LKNSVSATGPSNVTLLPSKGRDLYQTSETLGFIVPKKIEKKLIFSISYFNLINWKIYLLLLLCNLWNSSFVWKLCVLAKYISSHFSTLIKDLVHPKEGIYYCLFLDLINRCHLIFCRTKKERNYSKKHKTSKKN